MNLSFNIVDFGEKMQHWHNGMDAVYAVGSFAFAGQVNPNRDTIERARDILARDQERGQFSEKSDQEELAYLVECLDEILRLLPAAS